MSNVCAMGFVNTCDDMESSPSLVLGANVTAATAQPRAAIRGTAEERRDHERHTRSRARALRRRTQTRTCTKTERDQCPVWPRHYPPVSAGFQAPSSLPQSASSRSSWLWRTLLRLEALLLPRGLRVGLSARPGMHTDCLSQQRETPLSLTPSSQPTSLYDCTAVCPISQPSTVDALPPNAPAQCGIVYWEIGYGNCLVHSKSTIIVPSSYPRFLALICCSLAPLPAVHTSSC